MYWNNTIKTYAQAFTLIEVIVALAILAFGILGVMAAFSLCTRTASDGFRLAEAVSISQRELELAVNVPLGAMEPKSGTSGLFKWKVTFVEKDHDLVLASVLVQWTRLGKLQTFHLSQVFMPHG
jgi:prepilin-type N-terminal cleavage/methylation domain-containing protein